jgi:predicted nucleic acid-binding protein
MRTEHITKAGMVYMLDTTVFNAVLEGRVSLASLAGSRLLVIGVQADELRATPNQKRRAELLAVLEQVRSITVPASSFAFDIEGAGWGQAHWNDGSGNFQKMLARLQELDGKKDIRNQLRDILIAETAIQNGATLVTGDANLRKVVLESGGRAIAP